MRAYFCLLKPAPKICFKMFIKRSVLNNNVFFYPKKHFHYLQMSCVALLSFKISIYEYVIIFHCQSVSVGHTNVCRFTQESAVIDCKAKVPSCSCPS